MTRRLAAAAVVTLTLTACSGQHDTKPSSTPSTTNHAADYAAAEAVIKRMDTLPGNGQVQADYIDPTLLHSINASHATFAAHGAHIVGQGVVKTMTPLDAGTFARRGDWVRIHVCSVGDPRLIDAHGRDITVKSDGVTPMPKGPKTSSYTYTLYKSAGQWQITGIDPSEQPC